MIRLIDPDQVTDVELVDGLGRRRVTFNTEHITFEVNHGVLTITHDGDSMDSTLTKEATNHA